MTKPLKQYLKYQKNKKKSDNFYIKFFFPFKTAYSAFWFECGITQSKSLIKAHKPTDSSLPKSSQLNFGREKKKYKKKITPKPKSTYEPNSVVKKSSFSLAGGGFLQRVENFVFFPFFN